MLLLVPVVVKPAATGTGIAAAGLRGTVTEDATTVDTIDWAATSKKLHTTVDVHCLHLRLLIILFHIYFLLIRLSAEKLYLRYTDLGAKIMQFDEITKQFAIFFK